jgi:hypothetical protein
MNKFIIVTEESVYSNMYKVMFNDVINDTNVTFVNKYFIYRNKLCLKGLSLLFSNKLNKILKYNFENIVSFKYYVDSVLCNSSEETYVIFTNASLQKYYTLKKLCMMKKRNIKLILLFLDPLFAKQSLNAYEFAQKGVFDLVFSFDEKDSILNNYIFWPTPYSRIIDNTIYPKINDNNGVYFCGSLKGRDFILNECALEFKKHKVEFEYDIYGEKRKIRTCKTKDWILKTKTSGYISYKNIVKKTQKYNCILDIVQPGQNGFSLRPYEAVCYNKKLITNNPNIFKFKYYNPKYMMFFEKINDIDFNWIMDDTIVDYRYKGDYSPKALFREIVRRLNR